MSSLRRLALIITIAIIPVASVLMHQKVFAFHLKHGATWYLVKLIYVSWTQVFPVCLSVFLCFWWFTCSVRDHVSKTPELTRENSPYLQLFVLCVCNRIKVTLY